MAIPRVGQELIIGYLDGDADQPIAIGRAYRQTNLPPYELPKHKTRMTIKSRTHKGEGFNELRFEDELGHQEVFIHAEKDKNVHIKNNNGIFVGNDRQERVEHDEKIEIGHDRTEQVSHNETVSIGQDHRHAVARDRFHYIGQNHEITIENNRIECVGNERHDKTGTNHHIQTGGNVEHNVHGHHRLTAGKAIEQKTTYYEVNAGRRIVFKAPGGTITLDESGITIDGILVTIKGQVDMPGRANSHDGWRGEGRPATGNLKEFFILRDATTGDPIVDRPYEILRGSGHTLLERTDAEGKTKTVSSSDAEPLEIQVLADDKNLVKLSAGYWDDFGVMDIDFSSNSTSEGNQS